MVPALCGRVLRFCETYETADAGRILVANFAAGFGTRRPELWAIVGVNKAGGIVGHVLISLDQWTGKTILVILQWQMDYAAPASSYRDGLAIVKQLAATIAASEIRLMARTEHEGDMRRWRLFRRFGFAMKGVVGSIVLPVPEDAATLPTPATDTTITGGGVCAEG